MTLEWILIIGAVAGLAGVVFWLVWSQASDEAAEVAGSEHFPAAFLAAQHITSDARAALPPARDTVAVGRVNERFGRECRDLMVAYRDVGLRARWDDAAEGDTRATFEGVADPLERARCVVAVGEGSLPAAPPPPPPPAVPLVEPEVFVAGDVEGREVEGREGDWVVFEVVLSEPVDWLVTVGYSTGRDESAVNPAGPDDYGHVEGRLRFPPGGRVSRLPVSVQLLPDDAAEDPETFRFCLQDPTGRARLRPGGECAAATILDGAVTELPTVRISDVSAYEGGALEFRVTLSKPPSAPVSMRVDTVELTGERAAESGKDFVAVSGRTLTIPAGGTYTARPQVRVATVPDRLFELPELFEVRLSALVGATFADGEAATATATGTILDDDAARRPVVSVADVQATEGPGETMTFELTLSEPSGAPVVVAASTRDGTARVGMDYLALADHGVTIRPEAASASVRVKLVNDDVSETLERFELVLSDVRGADVSRSVAEGLILDDDDPPPEVWVDDAEEVIEGTSAVFTVRLSAAQRRGVTVWYETADGAGTGGATGAADCSGDADYVRPTRGAGYFRPGDTDLEVTVATCHDTVEEALREVFSLRPTRVSPWATVAPDAAGVGTILDDDATPTVGVRDAEVREDAGEMRFEVRLNRPSQRPVSLRWWSAPHPTATHPATPGTDFTELSGDLRVAPGEVGATVAVPILDDELDEYEEAFWLRLDYPTGGTESNAIIGDGLAVGTIFDDDDPPLLSIGDAEALEGDALRFVVRLVDAEGRAAPSPKRVEVKFNTSDITATAWADYRGTAPGPRTGKWFEPGVTEQTIGIKSIEDGVVEGDETFLVYLSVNINADLAGGGRAVGTILDDDPPRLGVGDVTVTEGEDSAAGFVVTLSDAAEEDVTFSYATRAVSGGAQPGAACVGGSENPADYLTVGATTGTIAADDTEFRVDVAICDDEVPEEDETFLLAVSGIAGAEAAEAGGGDTTTATAAILDDDGIPRITVADAEASEGDGAVVFTVTLSHAAETDVAVDYRTFDSGRPTGGGRFFRPTTDRLAACARETWLSDAFAGEDYRAARGTLLIPAGDVEGTIAVEVHDDDYAECPPREYFTLRLALPEPADPDQPPAARLADAEATGTIIDDDAPPVAFVNDVYANEDDGTVSVRVELDKPHHLPIAVPYRTADGSQVDAFAEVTPMRAPGDYAATSGTLVFEPGSLVRTFDVTLRDNDDTNPATGSTWGGVVRKRWFWVILNDRTVEHCDGELDRVRLRDEPDCAQITVRDDERRPVVEFTEVTYGEVLEGAGTLNFTIHLDGFTFDEDITVEYQTSPRVCQRAYRNRPAATPGVDFVERTAGLTFDRRCYGFEKVAGFDDEDANPGTVTIRAGETSAVFGVGILDDEIAEQGDPEYLQVVLLWEPGPDGVPPRSGTRLVESGNAEIASRGSAVGGIIDDDAAPVLSVADAQAPEGGGPMRFRVSLSRPCTCAVRARYATADIDGAADAATAGDDYEVTSGLLLIPAGDRSAFIDVPLIEDTDDDEGDERFEIELAGIEGATSGDAAAVGTILAEGGLPVLTVSDSSTIEDDRGAGGGSRRGNLFFWLRLSEPNTRPVSLTWGIEEVPSLGEHAARRNEDFRDWYYNTPSGLRHAERATLPPPDEDGCLRRLTSGPVGDDGKRPCAYEPLTWRIGNLVIAGDDVPERDERLRLWLSDPSGVVLGDVEAWGTIINNDQPILSIDNVKVSESATHATFTLTLHEPGLDPVSVRYRTATWPGGTTTANPGEDYTETTGTATFEAGATTAEVSVPILDDTADEYDEAFVLQLHDPDGLETSNAQALALILDDDPGWWIENWAGGVQFYGREGDRYYGTARFRVFRDEPADAAVTLHYDTYDSSATGGPACTDGVDYLTPPGSLEFPAGETAATFTITVCDDAVVERAETFTVVLRGVTGRRSTVAVTIYDND